MGIPPLTCSPFALGIISGIADTQAPRLSEPRDTVPRGPQVKEELLRPAWDHSRIELLSGLNHALSTFLKNASDAR